MKVIYANSKTKLSKTAIAIGIFDGVHRGHQYLLKAMLKKAQQLKAKPVVITFFPHPAHVLRPDLKLGYLVSLEHRFQLLARLGVDACIVIIFTKKFAAIEPAAFIREVLVKRLGAKAIFVGEDFHFGRDRMGDIKLLQSMAHECGYEMHPIKAIHQGGQPISSTRLRNLITDGNITQPQKLLGRPFSIMGKVVKGDGRGKSLGFPTANVAYKNDILPPNGVYAVRVMGKYGILNGVANLGVRPSFKDKNPKVHLEVFIFDFKKDLYGQILEVEFIKKIRSEEKFNNVQDLIHQIQKDAHQARQILK